MARVPALLLMHGDLAAALLLAAETVYGPVDQVDVLRRGLSREALKRRSPSCGEVDRRRPGSDRLLGRLRSMCCGAAVAGVRRAVVITGINRRRLIDYLHNRDQSTITELVERLLTKASRASRPARSDAMSWLLVRVDDRLIHGQVGGVGRPIAAAPHLVVDDGTRPPRGSAKCCRRGTRRGRPSGDRERGGRGLRAEAAAERRAILLVRNLATRACVDHSGAAFTKLNLGGLHYAPVQGQGQRVRPISNEVDRGHARALIAHGVRSRSRTFRGSARRRWTRRLRTAPVVSYAYLFTILPAGWPRSMPRRSRRRCSRSRSSPRR